MAALNRFLPQALCCFYIPQQREEQYHRSPVRTASHVIPRKPAPYATINVPHEPEMADAYQFRRLFTQSPACPHENTPVGDTSERLKPQGLLDQNFIFYTGSPNPPKKSTSLQKLSTHIKQKMSESGLSRSSSKAEHKGDKKQQRDKEKSDLISDDEAVALSLSAQSTGLTDLLQFRSGSMNGYDSDAKSIKTPQLQSVVGTVKLSPAIVQTTSDDADIRPEDSFSNYQPSVKLDAELLQPPKDLNVQRPVFHSPLTPKKMSFSEALQIEPNESPDTALKRLSTGIVNGTIRHPTTDEFRQWQSPSSERTNDKLGISLQVPRRSSSLHGGPDTPQTVVKRLSLRINEERKATQLAGGESLEPSTLLDQLDPALVEYLSRFSLPKDTRKLDGSFGLPQNTLGCKAESPNVVSKQSHSRSLSQPPTVQSSRSDIASLVSCNPSDEQQSVHLFNMDISQRLASKSTATMLSPTSSGNTSRKSLECYIPVPPLPTIHSVGSVPRSYRVRAEHNRRPSDPHTKQLFEQLESLPEMQQPERSISIDASKRISEQSGSTSSCYTPVNGPRSSSYDASTLPSKIAPFKNANSIAVGGRSASSEIPTRSSSRANNSISQNLLSRSLSTSMSGNYNTLEAASRVINKYVDGITEAESPKTGHVGQKSAFQRTEFPTRRPRSYEASPENKATNLSPEATPIADAIGGSVDTTTSNIDGKALRSEESTTDMWNRAFRNAYKDKIDQKLLSTGAIEMDHLRRLSSTSTARPKHRSSVTLSTPTTVIRRSHSEEPQIQASPWTLNERHARNVLFRTLKRLSMKRLNTSVVRISPVSGTRKLQKRSAPQLGRRSSLHGITNGASIVVDAEQTLPLRDLLGIWGSFPSYDRDTRTGPAGEEDNIIIRDFGLRPRLDTTETGPHTPFGNGISYTDVSSITSKLRRLSARSRVLKRKARSVSFPLISSNRMQKRGGDGLSYRFWREHDTKELKSRDHPLDSDYHPSHNTERSPGISDPEKYSKNDLFNWSSEVDNVHNFGKACKRVQSVSNIDLCEYDRNFRDSRKNSISGPQNSVNYQSDTSPKTRNDSNLLTPIVHNSVADQNPKAHQTSEKSVASNNHLDYLGELHVAGKASTAFGVSRNLRIPGRFEVD